MHKLEFSKLRYTLGHSKSCLMSSSDLPQLFFNSLGNLVRFHYTGSWQTFQFARRARKKTLVTTGLTVLLQYLLELWRKLFWELLKNTWKTMQSLVIANMGSQGEKSCFTNDFPLWQSQLCSWPRDASWCKLFGFQQSFQYCVLQSPGQNSGIRPTNSETLYSQSMY